MRKEFGPRSLSVRGGLEGAGGSILKLISDVGLEDKVVLANPLSKTRYIYWQNGLRKVPSTFKEALPYGKSKLLMKGVWPGILAEPFRPGLDGSIYTDTEDMSVGEFFTRRFNSSLTEKFIDPMVAGIYAGDTHRISMQACFPQLFDLARERNSLILGGLLGPGKKRGQRGFRFAPGIVPTSEFKQEAKRIADSIDPAGFKAIKKAAIFSLQGGLEGLTQALSERISKPGEHPPVDVRMNSCVTGLEPHPDGVQVHFANSEKPEKFDYVFYAGSAESLGTAIKPASLRAAEELASIPSATLWIANATYRRRPQDRVDIYYYVGGRAIPAVDKDIPRPQGFGMLVPADVVREKQLVTAPVNSFYVGEKVRKSFLRSHILKEVHPLYGLLGIVFDSDIFPSEFGLDENLAVKEDEDEITSLTCMIGGDRYPTMKDVSEDDIKLCVKDYLTQTLGITVEPESLEVHKTEKCIPQYRVGHVDKVKRIREEIGKVFGVAPPSPGQQAGWPRVTLLGASYESPAIPNLVHDSMQCGMAFALTKASENGSTKP